MKVVHPYLSKDWAAVMTIAKDWTQQEPNNVEAWFYLAAAEYGMDDMKNAKLHMRKANSINIYHPQIAYYLDLMDKGKGHVPLGV